MVRRASTIGNLGVAKGRQVFRGSWRSHFPGKCGHLIAGALVMNAGSDAFGSLQPETSAGHLPVTFPREMRAPNRG